MDEERDPASAETGSAEPQPATTDLWTVALVVFFVSLIVIVAALLILPQIGG